MNWDEALNLCSQDVVRKLFWGGGIHSPLASGVRYVHLPPEKDSKNVVSN